ncbi:MAG: hypothetical protein D6746_16695 [Bacteroidetes bacterium]|nr:MAG: hypothetical protein D6746_16695 [Bacteroidota bacterium]
MKRTIVKRNFSLSEGSLNTWFALAQKSDVTNLGVLGARLFGTQYGFGQMKNMFVSMTQASGRVINLPARSSYVFSLKTPIDIRVPVVDVITAPDSNGNLGALKQVIEIVVGDSYLRRNQLLLTSHANNAPMLRLIEDAKPYSDVGFLIRCVVQDSDETAFVPYDAIAPGTYLVDASSSVADELAYDYAGVKFGGQEQYQGYIGRVRTGVKLTDGFLKAEAAAAMEGRNNTMTYEYGGASHTVAISEGAIYTEADPGEDPQALRAGTYVSRIEEMVYQSAFDRLEMLLRFGREEFMVDDISNTKITVAPGFYQLVQEGAYMQHNGSIDFDALYNFLSAYFLSTTKFLDRNIVLRMGQGGILKFHEWVKSKAENSPFTVINEPGFFMEKVKSQFHINSLAVGYQFTVYRAPNGLTLTAAYDPMKDNRHIFQQTLPGTDFPIESYNIDIIDLGSADSDVPGAMTSSNIAIAKDPLGEEYYWVKGVYDPYTGKAVVNGSTVENGSKMAELYVQTTGGLHVTDVTRIGRVELNV